MIKFNLLLIDDNAEFLSVLAEFLKRAEYNCDCFSIPERAVERYYRQSYDVVITDLVMPRMNGLEILEVIRSINNDAKVIIMTGSGDRETAQIALNKGAYAFLNKPINLEELMHTLNNLKQ